MCILGLAAAARGQAHAEYIGGTADKLAAGTSGAITVGDQHYFAFYSRKSNVRVSYDKINLLEYGQKLRRRLDKENIISPSLLLVKYRNQFLTDM